MITLVIGTNNSGKSALAEQLLQERIGKKKYYIATMIPFGDEGIKRVEKHRKMREGKGFETLEWPTDLDKHIEMLNDEELIRFWGSDILLECMSNLVGNEMYAQDNRNLSDTELILRVMDEVRILIEASENVVIVTNIFPSEDDGYDEETRRYVGLTQSVNEELLKLADRVYEFRNGAWIEYENH